MCLCVLDDQHSLGRGRFWSYSTAITRQHGHCAALCTGREGVQGAGRNPENPRSCATDEKYGTISLTVQISRVQIKKSVALAEAFPTLGVSDAFNRAKADRLGISDEELFVPSASHKAKIKVP